LGIARDRAAVREPEILRGDDFVNIGKGMHLVEEVTGSTAVAVILQAKNGELEIIFNPCDEVTAHRLCSRIEWEPLKPIIAEYAH
jgi:hypothetical protein